MASDTISRNELADLVSQQVDNILRGRGVPYTMDDQSTLEKVNAQISGLLADNSLGRILTGPLWLSGASVVDGTVTADKLIVNTLESITVNTGALNVTGDITAAASFPAVAARVRINSSGLYGFQSDGVTTTFKLNVNGSGEIGSGSNKITWTTSGVLSVPVAVITSLTIADVGSGNLGGSYATGAANPKIVFSASSIVATDSGGNETFKLNATTGAMTATGSFTVKSAASGARVELSSAGGIEGFNSVGTSTFLLNAATGAGRLGVSGGGLSWDSAGAVSVSGSLLVSGSVTANVITTGTLSAARVSGGTLGGGFAVGANSITIPAGGTISDADGSEWNSSGIVLVSAGAFGDSIKWKVAGVDKASIYASSTNTTYSYISGGLIQLDANSVLLLAPNGTSFIRVHQTLGMTLQTGTGLDHSVLLGDGAGAHKWQILTDSNVPLFGVNSLGDLIRPIANDSTAEGAYYGRIPIYINGSLKYISVHSA